MWSGVGTWLKGAVKQAFVRECTLLSALAPHTPCLFGQSASALVLTCADADTNRDSPLRRRAYSTCCVLVLLAGLPGHARPGLLLCCSAVPPAGGCGCMCMGRGGRAGGRPWQTLSPAISFTPSRHPFPPCADHGYQSLPCCPPAPPPPLYIASSCSVAPPSSLRFSWTRVFCPVCLSAPRPHRHTCSSYHTYSR